MTSSPASRRAVTFPPQLKSREGGLRRAASSGPGSAQASVGASQRLLGRSRAVPAELTPDLPIQAREP